MQEQTHVPRLPAAAVHVARFAPLRLLDLPHLTFAVLFIWLLFTIVLNDPDYFWHLKTGEYIVAHMNIPLTDPFSYTFQGHPWAPAEWLFELALYGVFALLGTTGVKLLTALLGVLSLYIVYRTASRLLGASTPALVLTVACFPIAAPFFVPRPQLCTYVLFAVFVHLLIEFKYSADVRRLWLIPALLIIWVNLHGAYVVGIALLALFSACEWLRHLTRRGPAADRRRLVKLSVVTVIGTLATLINPDGIGAWLFPIEVMQKDYANSVVGEWQSPNFRLLYGKVYLVLIVGFFLANIYRHTKPDLTEIILPVSLAFAGFVSTRHTPLAMLILVPFVAIAVRDSPVQRFYGQLLGRGKELGNIEYVLNWALLCVVALALYILNPAQQAKAQVRLNETMPVKAVEFLKSSEITGRMFNEYDYGGYLIYRLYPEQQVFIDGRSAMYGDEFLKEFRKIRDGAPGWEKAFDRYAIDYLLVRRETPIRGLLASRRDFKLVYEDDTNSVLVRKLPRFEHLTEQKAE